MIYDESNSNYYDFHILRNTLKIMTDLDGAINDLTIGRNDSRDGKCLRDKESDRYIQELEMYYVKIIDELKRMQEKLIKFKNEKNMNEVME